MYSYYNFGMGTIVKYHAWKHRIVTVLIIFKMYENTNKETHEPVYVFIWWTAASVDQL